MCTLLLHVRKVYSRRTTPVYASLSLGLMAEEGIDWVTWNGYTECPHNDGYRMPITGVPRKNATKAHHTWWFPRSNPFGSVGSSGQLIVTHNAKIQRALSELNGIMGIPDSCRKYDINVTRKYANNKITYTINVTPHGTTTKTMAQKVSSELSVDLKALLDSIITH